MSKTMNTAELAAWVEAQVPLCGEYDESPDHTREVAERLRELDVEVERLKDDLNGWRERGNEWERTAEEWAVKHHHELRKSRALEAELASAFVLKESIKIEETIKVNLRREESGHVWLTLDQGPTKAKGMLNLGRQSWPENCSFFGQVLADVIGEGNGRDFWSNYEAKVIVADYVIRLKEAQAEVERLTRNADLTKWSFKIQVADRDGDRLGPYNFVDVTVNDIGYADKVVVLSTEDPLVQLSDLREAKAEIARLKAELERLRLTFLECAHCKGAMLVSTEPPCCDNCTLDEEDVEDWEERVLWSKHEGGKL